MQKNSGEKQDNKTAGKSALVRRLRLCLIFAAAAVCIGVLIFLAGRSEGDGSNPNVGIHTVTRLDLTIDVTESGSIKALNSVDIKSEVEGRTTIISIVDEGTYITAEDVNNGKILVELDSSKIEQELIQNEATFLSAEASYTDANEALDIQKKQNDSDIKAGQRKVRFTLLDLKKYLGEVVAGKLLSGTTNPGREPNEIVALIYDLNLGGDALQRLRELDADIFLKTGELKLSESKLESTQKLYDKGYASLRQKEIDSLDKERKETAWEKAKTAKELFTKYEFLKETEKLSSDYDEAKSDLERIKARARSKLAQAQAKLSSNRSKYLLQKRHLEKLQKQLEACVIRAPAPGQVVYSSSMMNRWERRRGSIEVGAEVRERQKIISIPDPSEMKVEIKVHETWVDKVQPGQKAKITITAFPDKTFTGEVLKKAPLAAPEEWLNPDHKVYSTDVSIDGTHDFIKTGMTAKVEVIINQLHDVICVPIQAVVTHEGQKVCYVMTRDVPQKREVETGLFNDDFVEIKSGLAEGDKVLLNPPRVIESETGQE